MLARAALAAAAVSMLTASVAVGAPAPAPAVGVAEWTRLDLLPRLRDAVKVASVSSYDRTGGNDDGFSGRHSFVRKEGDALVLADLKGPGCVYRIWTPTPTDDPFEFYFDGEAQPRLRLTFRQLFDGTRPPFVAPLSGYGAGGFWAYLPLPYRQSLKVIARAPRIQFYQINYATYADGHPVETFRPDLPGLQPTMEQLGRLFAAPKTDLSAFVAPPGAAVRTTRAAGSLAPGKSLSLFKSSRGGRVLGIRIRPASALAGKDRAVVLRAFWDGDPNPAISAPAGDFFAFSWGDPAGRSLLLGTEEDTCYVWMPMPFDRSARIELMSDGAKAPVEIQAEVFHTNVPRREDEGRFYAVWRRENPTRDGQPFTFVDTRGRGHIVGVALQSQGMVSGLTPFFEGDDQATLDSELTIHGTGSEDFFNGGWYDVPGRWETRLSFPLSGCLDYKKHLARTGAYRLFLTDAYAFRNSARLVIEHGPEKNAVPTDYAGVAYLYLKDPPPQPWELPPPAQRVVKDLDKLVFVPGWTVPIHSFSFQGVTLTKKTERLGGREARYLSARAEGSDIFGDHSLSFLCEVPLAGRYRVSVETMRGPDQGRIQLFQNEKAMGEPLDLYEPARSRSAFQPVGTLDLREGGNPVFFKLMGKNAAASGIGFDLISIQLERIP